MLRLSYQFLIKNKKKSLAILLSVVLSSSLLAGIGALLYSANISKSRYYAEINGNYQYGYRLNEQQIKKLDDVLKSSKASIKNAGIATNLFTTDEPKVMEVIGCNPEYLKMNEISLLDGRLPQKEDEIVLEKWIVKNLKLKNGIGENLKFDNHEFKIVGIVSDSFEKYSSQIVAYTFLGDILPEIDYKLYVNFKLSDDIEKQSLILMRELGCESKDREANWNVIEPLGVKEPTDSKIDLITYIKEITLDENMISLIFGVFSVFILYSIVSVSVMQRMKEYGILASLGAENKHLFEIFFTEVFILFFIGFPLGCLLGIGISKELYEKFNHIFLNANISPVQFVVSKKVIWNGFILLFMLLIVIAVKTVMQISRQSKMDVIKSNSHHLLKDRRILAEKEKTMIFNLSHRYMMRKKSIFLGILFSMSIGGIILCCTDYVIKETKNENELTMKADDGLNSDYFINMQTSTFDYGLSENDIKKIEDLEGVALVAPVKHFLGATFVPGDKYTKKHFFDPGNNDPRLKEYFDGICTREDNGDYLIKGNIYGYNSVMLKKLEEYLLEGSVNSKRMEQENGVIVCLPQDGGTLKFDAVNLKPGEIIKIKVPKELDAQDEILKFKSADEMYDIKEFKILGTVKRVMAHNDYFVGPSGLDIIMTNSMMTKEFEIKNYNMVSISKKTSSNGIVIEENLSKIVNSLERCIFTDYTSLIERENLNLAQRWIFYVGLSIVIIIISMLHVLNSMNYLILSRKQDFGILRAIGLGKGALYKMTLREGFLYGVYSSIIMTIVIVMITGLLYFYLKNVSFLYEPRFMMNWCYIGICILVNIVLSMFAVFLSSKPLLSDEIVMCMKNE